ncbi:hypothetical protein HHI36_008603 [Cryptolaemus montrouzieri]|uniref:Uncharacterized protein n=1 Tax=Cryptolaemus montrouzieri TaxID=559131 RepID=A0ABD2MT93_9CUCU
MLQGKDGIPEVSALLLECSLRKQLFCSKGLRNRFDEQRLTLRIHRGRGSTETRHHCTGSPHSNGSNSTLTTVGSGSPSPSNKRHERIKISISYPSSENLTAHKPTPPNNLPVLIASSPSSYTVRYSVNGDKIDETSLKNDGRLRVNRGGRLHNNLTIYLIPDYPFVSSQKSSVFRYYILQGVGFLEFHIHQGSDLLLPCIE